MNANTSVAVDLRAPSLEGSQFDASPSATSQHLFVMADSALVGSATRFALLTRKIDFCEFGHSSERYLLVRLEEGWHLIRAHCHS